MADDLEKRGGVDRRWINVNNDYELLDWAKKLGVMTEQLKVAVRTVGDDAKKVEQYLYLKGHGDRNAEKHPE